MTRLGDNTVRLTFAAAGALAAVCLTGGPGLAQVAPPAGAAVFDWPGRPPLMLFIRFCRFCWPWISDALGSMSTWSPSLSPLLTSE